MTFEPQEHVGERVTLRGLALTARAGAIVDLDDGTPVYVAGLGEWDGELEGSEVEVTGTLRQRPSRVPEGEPHRHGLGETYALEDASWRRA
jgi:hypothetical protein